MRRNWSYTLILGGAILPAICPAYVLVDRQYSFGYYFSPLSQVGAAGVQGQTVFVGANSSFEQYWNDFGEIEAEYVTERDLVVYAKYSVGETPPHSISVFHTRGTQRTVSASSALAWSEPMGGLPGAWISDATGGKASAEMTLAIGSITGTLASETIGHSAESGMNGRSDSQSVTGQGQMTVEALLSKDGGPTSYFDGKKWYLKQKYKLKDKKVLGIVSGSANTELFSPWCSFDISSGANFSVSPSGLIITLEVANN